MVDFTVVHVPGRGDSGLEATRGVNAMCEGPVRLLVIGSQSNKQVSWPRIFV
jgi:hypothetical protein